MSIHVYYEQSCDFVNIDQSRTCLSVSRGKIERCVEIKHRDDGHRHFFDSTIYVVAKDSFSSSDSQISYPG